MRRSFVAFVFVLIISCTLTFACAQSPQFTSAPDVVHPGKMYTFSVESPSQGTVNVELVGHDGNKVCDIYANYPVVAGSNIIAWDGMRLDLTVIEQGNYRLRLQFASGETSEVPFQVGAPCPLLTHLYQIGGGAEEGGFEISYRASVAGQVDVELQDHARGTTMPYLVLEAEEGENSFFWEIGSGENALPPGSYALIMRLHTPNGDESMRQYLYFDIETPVVAADETEDVFVFDTAETNGMDATDATSVAQTPLQTTVSGSQISPPYSAVSDGSYWSMTPGELDDQVIWNILTQPITVYDGGLDTKAKTHAYMMENPDGTGARIAQLHAQSQGLHVIGEKNEHGYILVEAFSNYDENYYPKTEQERAEAFSLKQGYVKASHLKTVDVMTDIAFVIDKKTQRMYVFENGVRTEELLIATGKINDGKYYYETPPGEFITVSHTGDFPSGNMVCRMAIRINGGILLHEVPHKVNADGSRNYSSFEGYLGTKQSHGCVRIQRLPSAKMGYNQKWIWETLAKGKPYKVIIWDDLNRYDTPTTWYPNPKN